MHVVAHAGMSSSRHHLLLLRLLLPRGAGWVLGVVSTRHGVGPVAGLAGSVEELLGGLGVP